MRDGRPGLMSAADWKLIADAGVSDCDELDGVVDGVAEDPRRCRFDLQRLRCRPGVTAECLSDEQVAFARQFYAPLQDASGRPLDRGLLPGVLVDSGRSRLAPATFAQAIRHVADWDGKDFDADRDLAAIDRVMPELRADDRGPLRLQGPRRQGDLLRRLDGPGRVGQHDRRLPGGGRGAHGRRAGGRAVRAPVHGPRHAPLPGRRRVRTSSAARVETRRRPIRSTTC